MRWFKHMAHANRDEALQRIRDEFGLEGYGLYWLILETLAEQVDENGKTSIELSPQNWRRITGISPKKFQLFIRISSELGIFQAEISEKLILVDCPNLLKYRDEWSRKRGKNSGATPEQLRCKDSDTETETEKKEEPPTEACSELLVPSTSKPSDSASPSPVFVSIPLTKSQGQHPVAEADADRLQELYPAVDVKRELLAIVAWCEANPSRRKTRTGVKAFLTNWLKREQDRGGTRASPVARAAPLPVRDFEAERLEQSRRERAAWAAAGGD